jgi:GNAT superfamily N-acetyltransferase
MALAVRAVATEQDQERFVALADRLHRDEPNWIPPPPEAYAAILDRDRTPYFEHADAEYLLAERDGEVVGHVIAHIDHELNEFKQNRWGLFGFFRCVDDQEVANLLLEAAEQWLADRDREKMVGPLEFSTKEDPGLLIEGYDLRPVIFQPWHPPYYRRLLEGFGLTKAKDVLWRDLELDQVPARLREQMAKWAERVESRFGITIRPLSDDDPAADMERVYRFFPSIFASHWGYVPLTERELTGGMQFAVELMGRGTLIAELDGEVIGASMLVPDYLQNLESTDGTVAQTSQIDRARFMFMAVKPEQRHTGIPAAIFDRHLRDAERDGIKRLVLGWSVEDNEQMNAAVARLGLPVSRRHRIFEKAI